MLYHYTVRCTRAKQRLQVSAYAQKNKLLHPFSLFMFRLLLIFMAGWLPFAASAANKPPKVNAGKDKIVVYPSSTSTTLSGSGSDAEGPVTFKWTQIGGNSTATIVSPTQPTTVISKLKPGLYTFVLTVTDNSGVSRKDTTTASVLEKLTWKIGKSAREAIVHPATGGSGAAPVIFAFHGHGGTDSAYAAKGFELNWPEAIVVYPQGLRTSTPIDSNCKQSGWQIGPGEINCFNGVKDQDLQFFDSMLATIQKKYKVNSKLVFVHGWSNGADFVYNVLWAKRRNKLAALGPAGGNMDTIIGKQPIPVIHTAGTLDDKVFFPDQQKDVEAIRKLNKCAATGTVWATGASGLLGTKYASSINDPVVFLQYDGGHIYPATVPPLIVKFFKEVAAGSSATVAPLITKVPAEMDKVLASARGTQ